MLCVYIPQQCKFLGTRKNMCKTKKYEPDETPQVISRHADMRYALFPRDPITLDWLRSGSKVGM